MRLYLYLKCEMKMNALAESTFDFNVSREKILKQTTNKELENIKKSLFVRRNL